jgi:hypothetical protein
MKKFLLTLNVLFIIVTLRANPQPTPRVSLSEIYFEDNGKWVIELQYSDAQINGMAIDSIWIESSSGISKIRRFNITGSRGLIIVRNDSLLSPLTINPIKDSIRVGYVKVNSELLCNSPLLYGYSVNSPINSPKKGQSIAGVPNLGLYSLDKSPTIGTMNDTTGMCGTINGRIYDKYNKLLSISSGLFHNYETGIYIYPKTDGSYSTRIYSNKNYINQLFNYTSRSFVNITPIDVSIQPDSVVTVDIHILDELNVGINEISTRSESIIKIFPNPVSGSTLDYEIGIPVNSTHCYIDLVNLNGLRICRFSITENQGKISLPSNLENGIYFVKVYANNRNYSSSKVIIFR